MKATARILHVDCPPGKAVAVTVELTTMVAPLANNAYHRQQEAGLIDWVRRTFGATFELQLEDNGLHAVLVNEVRLAAAKAGVDAHFCETAHVNNVLSALVDRASGLRAEEARHG